MRGRVRFSVEGDSSDSGTSVSGDLFGRGIQALFRNYLAGREVGIGIAALAGDQRFLEGVRRFADSVYAEALKTNGASRLVDESPGNARVIDVIRAVYPDAFDHAVALGDSSDADPPPAARLQAPPVFIVGVPRSGTTWLEHMLLAHPGLRGPERETSIFLSMRALHDNIGRPTEDGVASWIAREPFVAALRAFAEELFAEYLEGLNARNARFLEKTPLHAEHLSLIAELFPEASILSIHRDGRDVVQSLLSMDAATDDAKVASTKWAQITAGVSAALPTLGHACDLRYEALVADPVQRVGELLEWLGLRVDDAVEAELQRRAPERVSQYNTDGEIGPGKWRRLSARDRRSVYRHAGDRLVAMGYLKPEELRRGRQWWRP